MKSLKWNIESIYNLLDRTSPPGIERSKCCPNMAQVSPVGHVATAEETGQAKVNGSGSITDLDQSQNYYRKEEMPEAFNGLLSESEVHILLFFFFKFNLKI